MSFKMNSLLYFIAIEVKLRKSHIVLGGYDSAGRSAAPPKRVVSLFLNRIHKRLLHPVKNHRADQQDDEHKSKTISHPGPTQIHITQWEKNWVLVNC